MSQELVGWQREKDCIPWAERSFAEAQDDKRGARMTRRVLG